MGESQGQNLFEPGTDVQEAAAQYMVYCHHDILRLMFLTLGILNCQLLKLLASNLCNGYRPCISEPSLIPSLILFLFLAPKA